MGANERSAQKHANLQKNNEGHANFFTEIWLFEDPTILYDKNYLVTFYNLLKYWQKKEYMGGTESGSGML